MRTIRNKLTTGVQYLKNIKVFTKVISNGMKIGLQKHRQKIFFSGSLLLMLLLLFIPAGVTHAEGDLVGAALGFLGGIGGAMNTGLGWSIGLALSPIVAAMTTLMAMVTSWVGSLFDIAISYTIVDYSTYLGGSIQDGINTVWVAFRDLANIALIGIFVYIAFMVMLGVQNFSAEKFAVRVIVIALLINFSLFFTKVVIDVSNITAIQFYKTLNVTTNNKSIAETFMSKIGISSAWSTQSFIDAGNVSTSGFTNLLAYAIFTSLFLATVISIFLYAIILLFSRALTFIFLMITSPLAFAAFMIPQMEKYWKTWWSLLIKNALFAPLFIMMLWATLTITTGLQGDGKSIANIITGDLGAIGGLFNIIIILGLFYASVKISSSLSLMGTNLAESIAKKSFNFGAQLSPGGMSTRAIMASSSWVARKTVGGGAALLQKVNKNPPRGMGWMLNSANLDKKLDKIANSGMRFGDLQMAKGLEKHTGLASTPSPSEYDQIKFRTKQLNEEREREAKKKSSDSGQPTTSAHDTARQGATEKEKLITSLGKELKSSQEAIRGKEYSLQQTKKLADTATSKGTKEKYEKHAEKIGAEMSKEKVKIEQVKKDIDTLHKGEIPQNISDITSGAGGSSDPERNALLSDTLKSINSLRNEERVRAVSENRFERNAAASRKIDTSKYEYQEPTGPKKWFTTSSGRAIERAAYKAADKPREYYDAKGTKSRGGSGSSNAELAHQLEQMNAGERTNISQKVIDNLK